MKTLLWLIGLFSLAVGLTLFAQVNTGYALLFLPPWRIELSLNVFIIVLAVFVALLYFVTRILAELTGLPGRVRAWRSRKQANACLKMERDAHIAFAEGRYQRAEKLAGEAMAASRNNESFAVNALLAARAAHMIRDFERRDQHFEALRQRLGTADLASAMTMAELYLDERRYTEANSALEQVRAISPKLTAAMRLELRLRQAEGNPDAVLKLVEQLVRADALDDEQFRRLHSHACLQKLRQQQMSLKELNEWWRRLPAEDRSQAQLVLALADSYMALDEPDLARTAIEAALDSNWSNELIERYGALSLTDDALTKQLAKAESWLASQPNDHLLLLTLGRLCLAKTLWGKAQNYLEASIAVQPTAVAHAELGQLCEQLERNSEANRHYRASLELALAP